MALSSPTLKTSGSTFGPDTGSWSTASFTPANNSLLVILLGVTDDGAGDIASALTITDSLGSHLTYTPRVTSGRGGGWKAQVREWTAPVTTGAAMTITFDCGANDVYSAGWAVIEYTGHDGTTPTGGIASSASDTADGALSTTLNSAPASGDAVVSFLWLDGDSSGTVAVTPGADFTELVEVGSVDIYSYGQAQTRTGSTSTTAAWQDIRAGTMPTYSHASASLVIKAAAAAGASGSLSATLAALTSAATGVLALSGALNQALAALTTSAAGKLAISGQASNTLGDLTPTATGTLAIRGALDSTLGSLTITAAGQAPISGTLSVTLDDLTAGATGALAIAGVLDATLDGLSTQTTGALAITAAADITLDALTLAGAGVVGTPPITGQLAAVLDDLATLASGQLAIVAQLAATLDAVTGAATGQLAISGQLAATLDSLVCETGAALAIAGAANVTLDSLALTATGAIANSGQLSVALATLILVATGQLATPASGPGARTVYHAAKRDSPQADARATVYADERKTYGY